MNRRPAPSRPALRRVATLAALASVAGPLAACGSGGNDQAWVGTFCGAGLSLRTVLLDANAHLRSQLAGGASPGTIKLSVVDDAARIAAAANTAKSRIHDAGDPTVAGGAAIQATAVSLYNNIAGQANLLPGQVVLISGSDAETLTAGVGPYSQQVADLSRSVAGSFTALGTGKGAAELGKASRKPDPETHVDETCARLQAPAP